MTLINSDNPSSSLIRSDRRGRLLVRAEQRAAILEVFDQSSLSAMAFCRQHNLSYSTFATWVQKRRKALHKPAEKDPPDKSPTFAEVLIQTDQPSKKIPSPIRIILPEGIHLEVVCSSQVPLALELIRALCPSNPC
ncbi:MAG: hypothetical protein QM627_01290 [Luteolibacter sp.]